MSNLKFPQVWGNLPLLGVISGKMQSSTFFLRRSLSSDRRVAVSPGSVSLNIPSFLWPEYVLPLPPPAFLPFPLFRPAKVISFESSSSRLNKFLPRPLLRSWTFAEWPWTLFEFPPQIPFLPPDPSFPCTPLFTRLRVFRLSPNAFV